MNPLYGLYYFHEEEKMEDDYAGVTDENSHYGRFNSCEIVCKTNEINKTQVNIIQHKTLSFLRVLFAEEKLSYN